MSLLINFILGLCVIIVFTIGAFASNLQSITLWAGKKIAPEGTDKLNPRGVQDAITPKIQDTFNTILPVCYVIILALGTYRKWYLGIVLLVISFFMLAVLKKLLPNKINFYLKIIIYYLDNRMADLAKQGDAYRVEAAKFMSDKLHELLLEIMDDDLEVPDFEYVRKMPNGRGLN